jgi:iron complex outermembrane receptor protein
MTGLNAIGGSVNFVSRQPTTGAIRSEVDLSVDSLGTIRSHFGSGGTLAPNLDYRFDLLESGQKGYIDDIHRDLTGVAAQFNYRASDVFTWFGAIDFKRDDGTATGARRSCRPRLPDHLQKAAQCPARPSVRSAAR